jgi:hypothetical protein
MTRRSLFSLIGLAFVPRKTKAVTTTLVAAPPDSPTTILVDTERVKPAQRADYVGADYVGLYLDIAMGALRDIGILRQGRMASATVFSACCEQLDFLARTYGFSSALDLPDSVRLTIRPQLALELCPEFGVKITPELWWRANGSRPLPPELHGPFPSEPRPELTINRIPAYIDRIIDEMRIRKGMRKCRRRNRF